MNVVYMCGSRDEGQHVLSVLDVTESSMARESDTVLENDVAIQAIALRVA